MGYVLLVTPEPDRFRRLKAALDPIEAVGLQCLETGEAALEAARRRSPAVAVVDETLPDMDGLTLVKKLLAVDAWIQTIVASRLPPEVFHEKSEGLGVMGQCGVAPDREEAATLAERIRSALNPG